jgi:hypothetical protein
MFGRMKMLRRVLVLRRVAATDMAANHTQSQMHPGVVHFQTFFASARMRLHVLDLTDMRTTHDSASHVICHGHNGPLPWPGGHAPKQGYNVLLTQKSAFITGSCDFSGV